MNNTRPPQELAAIQQWMQAVITHPHGVEAGIQSEPARALVDVSPQTANSVVLPSRRMSSVERLQIYATAYFARLLDCLCEEFPATAHATGDEAFATFAWGYLQAHPSQSYTLGELGRNFPAFLQATRPPRQSGSDADEADFFIELARLERIYSEVFDGPGIETARILQPEDLAAIAPQQWPQARLTPVACLRLVEVKFPVHEYISAVRQRRPAPFPSPRQTFLVVTRHNYQVRRRTVARDEFQVLMTLVAGATLGRALEQIAEQSDTDLGVIAANVERWFHDWAAAGYFQNVTVSPK